MPIKDSTQEGKLRAIVDSGRPKSIVVNGEKIYVSKQKIRDIKDREAREGGVFPLIPVLAGIAAAGSIAGGSAAIANAVNTKKSQNAQLEHTKANDAQVLKALTGKGIYLPEYQKGNGFSEEVEAFAKKAGLSKTATKILKTALKPLSSKLNMFLGEGLVLTPKKQT